MDEHGDMKNERNWPSYLPWVTAFAIAMGFLESAVVVYLRTISYPDGFRFPLASLSPALVVTELVREASTLVMLLAPGALISRGRLERFAWFCWSFAVWDLFYYVFLKLLLGWPVDLFTWDVLFLLPVVWVGPVLAPCLISIGLLVLAFMLLWHRAKDPGHRLAKWQWVVLILAAVLYFITFIEGPIRYLRSIHTGGPYMLDDLARYVPVEYAWNGFILASLLATTAMVPLLWGAFHRRR